MDMNKFYTITEISEKTEVAIHTLRYWESNGLINPSRTPSGRRRYFDSHIHEILRLKKLMKDEKLTTIAVKTRLKKINSTGLVDNKKIKDFLKELKGDIKDILKRLK